MDKEYIEGNECWTKGEKERDEYQKKARKTNI